MLILYIAIGGALGSVMRYMLTSLIGHFNPGVFPYGTLAVNVIGSLAMGMFIAYMTRHLPHHMEFRAFVATGILGGFTTFSAFSLDAFTLYERGEYTACITYILASVLFSLIGIAAGFKV